MLLSNKNSTKEAYTYGFMKFTSWIFSL
jgi:hypothetical protein